VCHCVSVPLCGCVGVWDLFFERNDYREVVVRVGSFSRDTDFHRSRRIFFGCVCGHLPFSMSLKVGDGIGTCSSQILPDLL
jgi:hypothetical protein